MNNFYRLEQAVQRLIAAEEMVGVSLAVVADDSVVYARGFGKTSVEEGGAGVIAETRFLFTSVSRTIVATLIMRLVADGRLDLDVPVVSYLPDLQFSDSKAGDQVTLRHLLSHTAGFAQVAAGAATTDDGWLSRFVLQDVAAAAFLFEPGRVYQYNPAAFALAGYVAERVCGVRFRALVHSELLGPLRMDGVTWRPTVAMTYPLALPHARNSDGRLAVVHDLTLEDGAPAGPAFASVLDLANLARLQLNAGVFEGEPLLPAAAIAEMQRPHSDTGMAGATHPLVHMNRMQGLGLSLGQYRGNAVVRHGGMSLSYSTFFDLFPDRGVGVVLLSNYSRNVSLYPFLMLLYDTVLDLTHHGVTPVAVGLQPHDEALWPDLVGDYVDVEKGRLVSISAEGDLILTVGERALALDSIGDDRYSYITQGWRGSVIFLRDSENRVDLMVWNSDPLLRITVDRSLSPNPAAWGQLAGLYEAQNGSVLQVVSDEYALYVAQGEALRPCTALNDNFTFLSALGLLEFEQEAGKPTGRLQQARGRWFRRVASTA